MPHAIASRIEGVSTDAGGLVGEAGQGPVNHAVLVTNLGDFMATFGGAQPGQELFFGVRQFFMNGGRRAWVVRIGGSSQPAVRRGLAALDAVQSVNLVCLPGLSAGRSLAAGAAYARARGAFFLGDPAGSQAATLQAMGAINGRDAGNAAVYIPRLRVLDPTASSSARLCGPAATVAGILARTDLQRGVWAVAAGTGARVVGAVGLTSAIDDRAATTLRGKGVNVIRQVPGHGLVLWGARTIGGGGERADDWKYVSVRRLSLYIEESLNRGLQWVVFEPNDEPTWSLVRRTVGLFLGEMFRQGAFAGATPTESYYIRCGSDTMTQQDLDRGRLVVEVGVAPLRPTEFVVFRIKLARR